MLYECCCCSSPWIHVHLREEKFPVLGYFGQFGYEFTLPCRILSGYHVISYPASILGIVSWHKTKKHGHTNRAYFLLTPDVVLAGCVILGS